MWFFFLENSSAPSQAPSLRLLSAQPFSSRCDVYTRQIQEDVKSVRASGQEQRLLRVHDSWSVQDSSNSRAPRFSAPQFQNGERRYEYRHSQTEYQEGTLCSQIERTPGRNGDEHRHVAGIKETRRISSLSAGRNVVNVGRVRDQVGRLIFIIQTTRTGNDATS